MYAYDEYVWVRWNKTGIWPAIVCDPLIAPAETIIPEDHLYVWWPGSPTKYNPVEVSKIFKFNDPSILTQLQKTKAIAVSLSTAIDSTLDYCLSTTQPEEYVLNVLHDLMPTYLTPKYTLSIARKCLGDLVKNVDDSCLSLSAQREKTPHQHTDTPVRTTYLSDRPHLRGRWNPRIASTDRTRYRRPNPYTTGTNMARSRSQHVVPRPLGMNCSNILPRPSVSQFQRLEAPRGLSINSQPGYPPFQRPVAPRGPPAVNFQPGVPPFQRPEAPRGLSINSQPGYPPFQRPVAPRGPPAVNFQPGVPPFQRPEVPRGPPAVNFQPGVPPFHRPEVPRGPPAVNFQPGVPTFQRPEVPRGPPAVNFQPGVPPFQRPEVPRGPPAVNFQPGVPPFQRPEVPRGPPAVNFQPGVPPFQRPEVPRGPPAVNFQPGVPPFHRPVAPLGPSAVNSQPCVPHVNVEPPTPGSEIVIETELQLIDSLVMGMHTASENGISYQEETIEAYNNNDSGNHNNEYYNNDDGGYNSNGYNGDSYDNYNNGYYSGDGYGNYNNNGYNGAGYNNNEYNGDGYNNNEYNGDGYNNNGDGYNNNEYNGDGYNNNEYNGDGYNNNEYNGDGYNNNEYNGDGYNENYYDENWYYNGDGNDIGNNIGDNDNFDDNEDAGDNADAGNNGVKMPRRKKLTIEDEKAKHPMKRPCKATCRQNCSFKFTHDDMEANYESYWNLQRDQRTMLIRELVKEHETVKKTVKQSRRDVTRTYTLKLYGGTLERCCKVTYKAAHGFNTDSQINAALAAAEPQLSPTGPSDRRGTNSKETVDVESIRNHIMSFNPTISHYRRAHAPNRLYLPADLNAAEMHRNYNDTHRPKVCVSVYRREVNNLNISFAYLTNEKCDDCKEYNLHEESLPVDHVKAECPKCAEKDEHHDRYTRARQEYQSDAEKTLANDEIIVSVDMEKVIMLPRMPGSKKCLFTPRIIAVNETFALVGPQHRGDLRTVAVLWHEATAERHAWEVANAYWSFFKLYSTLTAFQLWADNCPGQNKNWTLFSCLVHAANNAQLAADTITLKYFEAGHGFMSADTIHKGVEDEMKKLVDVECFADFVLAVSNVNHGDIIAHELHAADFLQWTDEKSAKAVRTGSGRPMLSDMTIVQFRRNSRSLFFKRHFDQTEFEEFDFLKPHVSLPEIPRPLSGPVGICPLRKDNILAQLRRIMRPTSIYFWENLPAQAAPKPVKKRRGGGL